MPSYYVFNILYVKMLAMFGTFGIIGETVFKIWYLPWNKVRKFWIFFFLLETVEQGMIELSLPKVLTLQ